MENKQNGKSKKVKEQSLKIWCWKRYGLISSEREGGVFKWKRQMLTILENMKKT